MARTGNYAAFYVSEPFNQSNLGASATKDFVYYNLLKAWKGADSTFPFNDSHDKNYNVRDGSDWEKTLKPRLHDRLSKSKNIVFFLSSNTVNSRAVREEIDYGVNTKELPVIVVYPEFSEKTDIVTSQNNFKKQVSDLWDKLPVLRDSMGSVPMLHIPNDKALIKQALNDTDFMVNTKIDGGNYFFS